MALAGHSDVATTQGYIDLAGEVFRHEAERLEERLFGAATRGGPRWLSGPFQPFALGYL